MKRIVVMTAAVVAAVSPIAISSAFAAEEEPSPLCSAVTDLGHTVHEATNLNLLGTAQTEACGK